MTSTNMTDFALLCPSAGVNGVAPYEPPAPRWSIDLHLDSNEGPVPDEDVLRAIRNVDAERVRRYPDARPLEAAIARSWGIDPSRVVITNGGDDAIDRVCRAVLGPGRTMLTHAPSFEMIARSARLAGGGVRTVEWFDGTFPERLVHDAIKPGVALVVLVSPNNPTGGVIDAAAIERIAGEARRVGALVLLDLAYVEFADEDPTPAVLELDNIVVVRTFSKAMGLAGLRVGYTIVPGAIGSWVRAAGGPYPVSGVSLAAGEAAWARRDERRHVDAVRTERARLWAACERLGLEPLRTQANFVTVRSERAQWSYEALGSLGIAVRVLQDHEGPPLGRITVPGDERAFGRLLRALETAINPEAILFDLDGVLADVSGSYRVAIETTARTFGIELAPDDVARAKAAGDANNDWMLTHRLLLEHGVRVELAAVIGRFQGAYLGDGARPGLRERERLIPECSMIERLAARVKLGVVTGRPRDEAEWFLNRAGVRACFGTLVAMEDAPPKPSADPVRLALARLCVERAWMVGDMPDDALAARGAGVVPVGVVAPGDEGGIAAGALEGVGVARVLGCLNELRGLLP